MSGEGDDTPPLVEVKMSSPDSKKELPPAQKFKRADINASFRSILGVEQGVDENPDTTQSPPVQETEQDKEKMLSMNIIESPPPFLGVPRLLPSISKKDLLSESSSSTLGSDDAVSPSKNTQDEVIGSALPAISAPPFTRMGSASMLPRMSSSSKKLAYPIDPSEQAEQQQPEQEQQDQDKPKESFARSIISKTRAYSQSIMMLTKGKRRNDNDSDNSSAESSPSMAKPLINPRVAEISGRPKSNSLKMLNTTNTTTNVNDKFRVWQRQSMMAQMEASQSMKDKKYKLLVESQHQRVISETPRAVQLEIIEQAYPIVLRVCQHYIKHLGEKHEITQMAIQRLSSMAAQLERECEYTPLNTE